MYVPMSHPATLPTPESAAVAASVGSKAATTKQTCAGAARGRAGVPGDGAGTGAVKERLRTSAS